MSNDLHVPARIPPNNIEAEQALLACLLVDSESYDRIAGIIEYDSFYVKNNSIIFEVITKLHASGEPHDITFVSSALNAEGKLEQIGGMAYLGNLTYMVPDSSNIVRYAHQIRSKYVLRKLYSVAGNIQELVYEYNKDITIDPAYAVDESSQLIFNLTKDGFSKDPQHIRKVVEQAYESLHDIYNNKDLFFGLKTGFIDLDNQINGLMPGSLNIIAARPGMGKTTFALNIAQNIAKNKFVAIFSLEMSSTQLIQRLMSVEAEVSGRALLKGEVSGDDWQRIGAASENIASLNIYIDDSPLISVMEIRGKCRRLRGAKNGGLDLIIIDYLQLMENKNIEQREQQIADISRNLKGLAKELNIPIIALSQLNRQLESRSDKRPVMADIRESGAIEQDADLILFIYREDYYNKDSSNQNISEIIIGKNRNGPTGKINLTFVSEFTKFKNYSKAYG